MWPYKTEQEALNDVLRLSRGMTFKAAVPGLNLGGGKAGPDSLTPHLEGRGYTTLNGHIELRGTQIATGSLALLRVTDDSAGDLAGVWSAPFVVGVPTTVATYGSAKG